MGKTDTSATPQAGLEAYSRTLEAIPPAAVVSERRPFLKRVLSGLRVFAINFVIFAVLAELASLIYINVTKWPGSKPSYQVGYNDFSADIDPAFGAWHRPNGHFVHKSGCYSVEYDTNSYGARDVERSVHSSAPRVIALGDSMIEGVGQPVDKRLTNILERDTGREYLNFGSSGFGPLQYALMYKTMASKFDHDLVIVGVVPDNDFHDMDFEYRKAHGRKGEYRPFYTDDFSIFYSGHFNPNAGEGFWDRVEAFLRAYLASYHVGLFIDSRLYWWRLSPYSGYHDYTSVDVARLEKALGDIKSTADVHGAKVGVFLIPHAIDFQRVHSTGANPLGALFEKWGAENGVAVKDLLPEMDRASSSDFLAYSLCDGHWSEEGNVAVARILEPWIQQIEASKPAQSGDAKPAKTEAKSAANN